MVLGSRVLRAVQERCRGRLHWFANSQHFFFCKDSNPDPLLLKLLQVPKSRIKSTLDQDMHSLKIKSSQLSWQFLVTSLGPSSPEKARLVLEWILENMLKEGVRDNGLFSELIFLCGKLQNVPLAMHVFSSMEANGVKPTTLVFNSLISACLSSRDFITSYSLFEIMESSQSYKPDFHTYNLFISAFSKSGNVDAMLAWYSAKKAAEFGPDLQMFESLILGCVNSRNFETADRIYKEMMISGIIPCVSILETMLEGFCKLKKLDGAEEFFKLVLDSGWEITENMAEKLVALYHELGQVERMDELLETMTKPCLITTRVLSRIHCGIVRMYAMLDRLDDVEVAVGRMLKQGLSFTSADDVEKVICSYFRRQAYDRLDLFLESLKSCYVLTRSTYDLLIAGYKRAGLHEKVDSVMEDMKPAGFS